MATSKFRARLWPDLEAVHIRLLGTNVLAGSLLKVFTDSEWRSYKPSKERARREADAPMSKCLVAYLDVPCLFCRLAAHVHCKLSVMSHPCKDF